MALELFVFQLPFLATENREHCIIQVEYLRYILNTFVKPL